MPAKLLGHDVHEQDTYVGDPPRGEVAQTSFVLFTVAAAEVTRKANHNYGKQTDKISMTELFQTRRISFAIVSVPRSPVCDRGGK